MRDVDASPKKDNNKASIQAQAKGAVEVARGAASKKDLTKHNSQKQDLPRVSKPASKDALDAMLEGGEPIEFGTTPDRELCSGAAITLGYLVCSEGDFTEISHEADGHTFKIQYTRPPRRHSSTGEMTSDDAAMLVRAFLLARISTTRAEVRSTLEALSEWRTKKKAAGREVNKLLTLLDEIESDHRHDKDVAQPKQSEPQQIPTDNNQEDRADIQREPDRTEQIYSNGKEVLQSKLDGPGQLKSDHNCKDKYVPQPTLDRLEMHWPAQRILFRNALALTRSHFTVSL